MSTVRNDVSASVGLYARGQGAQGLGGADLGTTGMTGPARGGAAQAFGDFGAFAAASPRFGLGGGVGAPTDAGLAARAAVAFIAET